MAYLDVENPKMTTIPTNYLCTNDMAMPNKDFSSNEKYKHIYTESYIVNQSSSKNHELVSVNMASWDDTTKIENIFDGNPSTFYHNNRNNLVNEENPFILVVDMKKSALYNNIKITSRTSGQYNLPITFKLYGSENSFDWNLVAEYENLSLSSNTVSANFDDAEFRYYKLYVTNTKSQSSGNTYVTISSIDFTYTFSGTELSPYDVKYYKTKNSSQNFSITTAESSYGKIIKGDGIAKFEFNGTGFMLLTLQDNPCKIKITVDNKSTELNLEQNNEKQFSYILSGLKNTKHKVTIKVITGNLCLDSILIK